MIRDTALNNLLLLANKQGYILTDDILDEGASLSFADVDWLSSTLMSKGILVYDESPAAKNTIDASATEFSDYAQVDYEEIYKKAIVSSPESEATINSVKAILPPTAWRVRHTKISGGRWKQICASTGHRNAPSHCSADGSLLFR